MKIILLEDIKKLGRKNEIKEVADGYARNFLIPRKKAVVVNDENLEWALEREQEAQVVAEKELVETQEVAAKLDGFEVIFKVKTGEQNQLFESVDAKKISQKLEEEGFSIKSEQINLEEKIKEIGEYPLVVSLNHNLEAEIRIIIESDNSEE